MTSNHSGLQVLVVEDEPSMLALIAKALRLRGHEVTACADAESAWAAFQTRAFPLVLMDWILPGMQGDELCRKIRAHPSGTDSVILMVTVRNAPGDLEAILEAGADDYLAKPVSFGELGVRLTIEERRVARVLERRLAEQRLREAKEAAEAGNRAKSEFLATVSHELRTPLHAISGFTEVLLYAPDLPEALRAHLEDIRSAARTLRRHIDDLLDASRLEYGKLSLVAVPFELESCVQEALEMLAAKAEAKDLELVLRYSADAPRAVIGDAQRIRQVVTNLVDNAIRFTETGHVLVEVSERASEPRHTEIRIVVEDTGIGIPEIQRTRIFDKFVQADGSLSRAHGGLGLGLALARQIIEQMSGRIELESTSGAGSRFAVTLTLPLDTRATNEAAGEAYRLREARVLIVEDKALNAQVLREYVLDWRMRNDVARSGEEALQLLRRAQAQGDPYRFAIVNVPLADMPVEELAGQLRADSGLRDTFVLLLTPAGGEAPSTLHLEPPVVGRLNRPVSPSQLMDAMTTVWAAWAELSVPEHLAPIRAPPPGAGDGYRVLLVEDNDLVRRALAMTLERLNCRVEVADNGATGVAKAAGADYDIILMDLQMPMMDGFAATERIHALAGPRGRVPIVALTAHAGEADRKRCLQAGMDGHIAKPTELDDLRSALKHWARKPAAPAAGGDTRPAPPGWVQDIVESK